MRMPWGTLLASIALSLFSSCLYLSLVFYSLSFRTNLRHREWLGSEREEAEEAATKSESEVESAVFFLLV